MAEYKWLNKEQTEILKYSGGSIAIGGRGWKDFQKYFLGGGVVDPWKTTEEIHNEALSEKLRELQAEKNNRTDVAIDTSDPRKKDKVISRSVKLLRREMKGTATAKEKEELDSMEVLDDYLDDLDSAYDDAWSWLDDRVRTVDEISSYDIVDDVTWPQIPA